MVAGWISDTNFHTTTLWHHVVHFGCLYNLYIYTNFYIHLLQLGHNHLKMYLHNIYTHYLGFTQNAKYDGCWVAKMTHRCDFREQSNLHVCEQPQKASRLAVSLHTLTREKYL